MASLGSVLIGVSSYPGAVVEGTIQNRRIHCDLAGGKTHVASAGKTRLLRKTENEFQEQRIDLKKLLRGQIHDVAVRDEDILFVPGSVIKEALSASTLVGFAATAAIYRASY
jgi:hypothetical protein